MPASNRFVPSVLLAAFLFSACTLHRRANGLTAPAPTAAESETPAAPDAAASYVRALEDLHFGQYLSASDARRSKTAALGWDIYHYDASDCRCLLGGEYLLAARGGSESSKTVLWMEGGGACFPGRDECTKEASVTPRKLLAGLASPDSLNPVKDWNFIYVPYCDGSIHLGDGDADYDGSGGPDHWFWGLKNTSAAVRLMKELFPQSREILVAGCSAGGYGTLGTAPIVRLQFPAANLYVLNESGLGLMNPAILPTYETAYRIWNITRLFPPDCPQCGQQFIYLYPWMLARDPRMKVAAFSSYRDATFSSNWDMAPGDYETLLLETTDAVRRENPEAFKRFFVDGGGHCVSDYSYAVGGVSIWDWIGYLVSNDPRWADILE